MLVVGGMTYEEYDDDVSVNEIEILYEMTMMMMMMMLMKVKKQQNNLSNNASSSSIPVTDCKPVIMILLASSEVGILSLTNCL